MRNYKEEFENRVAFIKNLLKESGAKGIVFGNSGGKDSALVAILCKAACDNTVGVRLPCSTKRNYEEDRRDAEELAAQYNIETRMVDLTPVKEAVIKSLEDKTSLNVAATSNIAPRLRMTTLYAIAASEGRLVARTGNASEYFVGYFTKWGDGANDFNPISDLTASEVFEFLRYLGAPKRIIEKTPSAALVEGQTDEKEMGLTYADLDAYIRGENVPAESAARAQRLHEISQHKREGIKKYKN